MSADVHGFVSTRQFGNAVVTIEWEMAGLAPVALNVPEEEWRRHLSDVDETGRVPSGMTTTVVQLDSRVIVIDPSLDDPGTRLRNEVDAEFRSWDQGPGLQAVLDALNIANADVNDVVITHTHFDHCLGLTIEQDGTLQPRFPNARHVLNRADWREDDTRPSPSPEADFAFVRWTEEEMWPQLRAIHDARLLDLVDSRQQIASGVTMIPAPGESPGHAVVRVASGDDVFYHLGDLVHYWFEFEHLGWIIDEPSSVRDFEAMQTSRQALLPTIAAENATITFSHAPFPGWGRITAHGDRFRWEPLK